MNFLPPPAALMIPKSPMFSQVIQQFPYLSKYGMFEKIKIFFQKLSQPFFFVKLILTSCRSSHDSTSPSSKCSPPTGTPSTFTRMEVHAGILSDLVWSCLFLKFSLFHVMILNIICYLGVALLPIWFWLTKLFFRQITLGLFSQIHDFLNHCYIFTRKYIFLFYFKHSLDTVNSLSRSNFLVLLLFKPWLSSSCTSSIENYILRLLEAALGRRALGRRRQGSEAVFRLLYRESQ